MGGAVRCGWVEVNVVCGQGGTWGVDGAAVSGTRPSCLRALAAPLGRSSSAFHGHANFLRQVTGLAVSPRHPYMFSAGLDKMVRDGEGRRAESTRVAVVGVHRAVQGASRPSRAALTRGTLQPHIVLPQPLFLGPR